MTHEIAVAVLLSLLAFPAVAHEVSCDDRVGILATDAQGRAVIGPEGAPVFAQEPGATLALRTFPALVGWQLRVDNLASEPSTVLSVEDPLLGGAQVTVHGAFAATPFQIPVGGSVTSYVARRIGSYEECLAVGGTAPQDGAAALACRDDRENRFVVTTETNVAECRARLVCDPPPDLCGGGMMACGLACVDAQSDPANCGTCGNVCASGMCVHATCTDSCSNPAETLCPSTAAGVPARCVDLSSDRTACGACGNYCGSLRICDRGTCVTPEPQPCAPGLTWCGLSIYTDRQPGCYDLQTTYNACGSCDAMPCRQSWDGSSHKPGRCELGVCATTP